MSEKTTSERLIAGILIIEGWYGKDNCSFAVEHDQVFFGPDEYSSVDENPLPDYHLKKLDNMGWFIEDYGWSLFV